MACQTTTTIAPPGAWIQVSEFRPGRKSLRLEFMGGAVIFSITKNLPLVPTSWGNIPAGFYYYNDLGGYQTEFEINAEEDGEIVEQIWYAWVIPASVPNGAAGSANLFANGTVVIPPGAFNGTLGAEGQGGSTFDADLLLGPTTGGGGAGFANTTGFDFQGATLVTVQCQAGSPANPGTEPLDTWLSITGARPTNALEGVVAASGKNGKPPGTLTGGLGALVADCIGTVINGGGNGGSIEVFIPGVGAGFGAVGSGGGGCPNAGVDGTDGANGINGPHGARSGGVAAGGASGSSDGFGSPNAGPAIYAGAGGASVQFDGVVGLGAAVGVGGAHVSWQTKKLCIITTLEDSELTSLQPPKADSTITVPLPRLTPEGERHLRSLMGKLNISGGSSNVLQNPPEYNQPNPGTDGG